MKIRRTGWKSLVFLVGVFGLGLGTLALAANESRPATRTDRPTAVAPASEAPSASFLELQAEALVAPRGHLANDELPAVPRIASPQR